MRDCEESINPKPQVESCLRGNRVPHLLSLKSYLLTNESIYDMGLGGEGRRIRNKGEIVLSPISSIYNY